MILVKLFGFLEINFQTVLWFIVGIIAGLILFMLIYALLMVLSIGDKKYIGKTDTDSLTEAEAKDMIINAQKAFKDKDLRGDLSKGQYFKRITYDLVYGIAISFFPNSKYPLLELTIDEITEALGYVQLRVNEILDRRFLRRFKKWKASNIFNLSRTTKAAMQNQVFHVAKETVDKTKIARKIVGAINPVNWFKWTITDRITSKVTNALYTACIGIVGEEAYKIYSKSVLNKEVDIDTDVNEIVDHIEDEIRQEIEKKKSKEENKDEILDNKKLKFKSYSLKLNSNVKYESIFNSECMVKTLKEN